MAAKPNKTELSDEGEGRVRHRFLNFKTGALNYSATLPAQELWALADRFIR
jgi:hypothetical protein